MHLNVFIVISSLRSPLQKFVVAIHYYTDVTTASSKPVVIRDIHRGTTHQRRQRRARAVSRKPSCCLERVQLRFGASSVEVWSESATECWSSLSILAIYWRPVCRTQEGNIRSCYDSLRNVEKFT
ncbi:hypothetical protein AVEN_18987-1 [Araneus ventricosus]|uniref:Uncharacterized protein n=1 Tax=Araneus ventricosus TaxID=182803 RepID=A0A4Y2VET4_ARAVE|nr:hypothetical protein AVEN_18987-1 [Araneus ventricosus]